MLNIIITRLSTVLLSPEDVIFKQDDESSDGIYYI